MPTNFELHMNEIKDSKGYYKRLRGKKDKAESIIRKVYNFIQNLYIKIISIVIVKDKFIKRYDSEDILKWAFRLLIKRINRYVWGESKNDKEKEYAILIMDQDLTLDKKKRKFISEMRERGVKYNSKDVDRILDTPMFVRSELHNGIQQ